MGLWWIDLLMDGENNAHLTMEIKSLYYRIRAPFVGFKRRRVGLPRVREGHPSGYSFSLVPIH